MFRYMKLLAKSKSRNFVIWLPTLITLSCLVLSAQSIYKPADLQMKAT